MWIVFFKKGRTDPYAEEILDQRIIFSSLNFPLQSKLSLMDVSFLLGTLLLLFGSCISYHCSWLRAERKGKEQTMKYYLVSYLIVSQRGGKLKKNKKTN